MRQLLTLLFFSFFSSYMYAQVTYTLADTAKAQYLLIESKSFFSKKLYDSAYMKADTAFVIFEKTLGKKALNTANAIHEKGRNLIYKRKLDEAWALLNEALNIKLAVLGHQHLDISNAYFLMGVIKLNQKEYDQALYFFNKTLDIRTKLLPTLHEDIPPVYAMIGNTFNAKAEYDLGIKNYEKALIIGSQIWKMAHVNIASYTFNLGIAYNEIGDYDKGIEYFKKTLDQRIKLLGDAHIEVAKAYNAIGISHDYKGEYVKGISYYEKALNIFINKYGSNENLDAAITLNNIGASYDDCGEYQLSLLHAQKALDIRLKLKEPNPLFVAISYNNIGNTYRRLSNFIKAIEYNQIALDIRLKNLDPLHPDLAPSYQSLAHCFEETNQPDKAIEYFQKAFDIYKRNDSKANVLKNIAIVESKLKNYTKCDTIFEKSLQLLNYKNANDLKNVQSIKWLINVLLAKGNYELTRFQIEKDLKYVEKASQSFQNASEASEYQSNSFSTEGGKVELKKIQNSIVEGIISCKTILAYPNQDSNLKQTAFDKHEQIKASLLQAQIKETNALKYANIPEDLLQKETQLRLNITWREKQKQAKVNAGKSETDSTVLAISSKLFDLKQDYDTLKQNLEKNYPEYYRLKYDTKTVSVEDVQKKLLSPSQTLLSYFVGDSSVFAFVVKLDTYAVYTIKKDFPLEMYVKQLRDGLYGYQTAAVKTEKLYEAKADSFAQAAFQLHQKLIGPLSILLTKEVILVPDGVLGYIPFDVLLSEKPKDATQFKSHHYFSKDHIISYNYSATLWHSMQNKKHKTEPTKNFVGYAPYYNGDTTVLSKLFGDDLTMRKGLDSLKYSGEEVFKAQKLMGGEAVLNQKATKKTFEETASNYRIIHLATHGKANDKSGDYCFLAFTEQKDSIDNELLYVRDIYNLSLNADLVVLSACETGIGELKRGEGIVSLARAFAYSGAKSMVTSLWSVNDKSTMQIMENFYRNLRKGQTKNYALWKAKQDYWEKAKGEFAHPFYWSSFIPIGDMKPVKMLP
jgi:CHAT domain-containing protein